ncbi:phenylacetate--CoA ligase family protein [Alcanivorax sp. DSM 26293]|uniref:phenylacetate--CoA ligase family protein n=1 Tax=Alcanivorax sp. DSM 26293 TaxID=1798238 RepID=UPI000CDEB5A6|nr:phenylacetate--CoA ligase family protein [Alcanivorax sp. DSM 26293]
MDLWSLYRKLPFWFQDFLITAVNVNQYRIRRKGRYSFYRKYYSRDWSSDKRLWKAESEVRLADFLQFSCSQSMWFSSVGSSSLSFFPLLEKSDLVKNLKRIKTIDEKDAVVSLTGGTTGASMKVLYTVEDTQERFALLDTFRAGHGYELGKKVAWFSGKNLATDRDVKKGRCYRDDLINKIRFFSTFHINERNFNSYWNALERFSPEFIVGFPSSVFDICEIADRKGLKLHNRVRVFFPTAEVVLPQHREVIGRVLGCQLVDQYASSEGAPFILECTSGRLHIHPLSGVFEVVDENFKPALEGELLVTSFTTHGTPLIRYRVGDRIKLAPPEECCECGSTFPLVERIDGRTSDYVLSPENGRVNLGNLSNSTKSVSGIIAFQVIQDFQDEIDVHVMASDLFTDSERAKFIDALRERVGPTMSINLKVVNDIPREKSGKFRIVKNRLST